VVPRTRARRVLDKIAALRVCRPRDPGRQTCFHAAEREPASAGAVQRRHARGEEARARGGSRGAILDLASGATVGPSPASTAWATEPSRSTCEDVHPGGPGHHAGLSAIPKLCRAFRAGRFHRRCRVGYCGPRRERSPTSPSTCGQILAADLFPRKRAIARREDEFHGGEIHRPAPLRRTGARSPIKRSDIPDGLSRRKNAHCGADLRKSRGMRAHQLQQDRSFSAENRPRPAHLMPRMRSVRIALRAVSISTGGWRECCAEFFVGTSKPSVFRHHHVSMESERSLRQGPSLDACRAFPEPS